MATGQGELAAVGATSSAPDQPHHQLAVPAPVHQGQHRRLAQHGER